MARHFVVAGRGGVPADATAVTGNLTVTDQSAGWAVYLGPTDYDPAHPVSTINFVAGEVRANNVTVALGGGRDSIGHLPLERRSDHHLWCSM